MRLASFDTNSAEVGPEDTLITNGYVSPAGEENNHKSYGYLRAPEVTNIIHEFLA